MKIIKEQYSLGKNTAHFCKIIEGNNGLKIKIDICSSSSLESYAHVSVFNSFNYHWNIIDNIPSSSMATPKDLFFKVKDKNPDILADDFSYDSYFLTNIAQEILGDNFSSDINLNNKERKINL